jgi:hypothetical protein
MANMLKAFPAPTLSTTLMFMCVWGGGHTRETDPTRNGWRFRALPGARAGVYLIGQAGKEGCATARLVGSDFTGWEWDVGIYWETPEEVSLYVTSPAPGPEGPFCDARFVQTADVPGWGLDVIREIEDEVRRVTDNER